MRKGAGSSLHGRPALSWAQIARRSDVRSQPASHFPSSRRHVCFLSPLQTVLRDSAALGPVQRCCALFSCPRCLRHRMCTAVPLGQQLQRRLKWLRGCSFHPQWEQGRKGQGGPAGGTSQGQAHGDSPSTGKAGKGRQDANTVRAADKEGPLRGRKDCTPGHHPE